MGQKMSAFVHAQGIKTVHAGGGGKKWQSSVHVVVECPLIKTLSSIDFLYVSGSFLVISCNTGELWPMPKPISVKYLTVKCTHFDFFCPFLTFSYETKTSERHVRKIRSY